MIEVERVWILRGANRWADVPVVEAEVVLDAPGTDPSELGAIVLDLQRRVGSDVSFSCAVPRPGENRHRVVFEFEEEAIASAALSLALDIHRSSHGGPPFDPSEGRAKLLDLAHDVRLGPSTKSIVDAALARGIPMRRLGTGSLVVLGHSSRQRRICTAETDATSVIAENIAQDKDLTRVMLRSVGVPVPEGRPIESADDAWKATEQLGLPIVVKPQFGNHGRGVVVNLTTREQVERAYAAARAVSSSLMVEQHIEGDDYRLLVVDGRLVAAALREPAHVIADGVSTIRRLVDEVNKDPRRSDGHATALSWIKLDAVELGVLDEQGFTPDSIPPAGHRVLVRRTGNLSTGGTATDVTDRVHPEVALAAVAAAKVIGLDIAGVDLVATDVSRTLVEQRAAVVEVNAGPGLRMHLEPSAGTPRPVGRHVVDMLFKPGETGRIPVVAVTGVNGKTTTTRLLAHLFEQAGHVVGMTCTDGMYVSGRRLDTHDCSGPRSARAVLLNPAVTAAVLETARGGIVREGLGFDRCDVGVVTNIGRGDHLGLRGIDNLDDLTRVKQVVVRAVAPSGTAVLNADDPRVAAMKTQCKGRTILFSRRGDPGHGQSVFVRDGDVVLRDGTRDEVLVSLRDVPMTHGGAVGFQVENVLAASAAAWAVGLPIDTIRRGLCGFVGDAAQTPGRFNVLHRDGATVIVDYAHNLSALEAILSALDAFPHERRTYVFGGCNRRDEEVTAMGALVGRGFDRAIVYRDTGNNDRADGELTELLRRGLADAPRLRERIESPSEHAAIEEALSRMEKGDLIVVGIEAIEESLAFVQSRLGRI